MTQTSSRREPGARTRAYGVTMPNGVVSAGDVQLDADSSRIDAERYTSTAFAHLEGDRLWPRVWQLACREDEIAHPGDHVVYRIGRQEYLVTRQHGGAVRAFENVCMHRGTQLRTGDGQAAAFRCPFHGWTWGIDGTLRTVPDEHLFPSLDPTCYRLPEARCEPWAGFVFIHPGPGAGSLASFLGPIADQLAPYAFERQVSSASISQPLSCNWKTAVEAFLETYHTLGIHPQLLSQLDDVDTSFELLGEHSRMIVPFGVPSPRLGAVSVERMLETYTDTGGAIIGAKLLPDIPQLRVGLAEYDGDADLSLQTVREYLISVVASRAEELGHDLGGLTREQYVDDWHYFVFPNVVFNINPLSTLMLRMRPMTDDPNRCWVDVVTLAVPNPAVGLTSSAQRRTVEEGEVNYGLVLNQDFENLPRVQRGLHARGLRNITLSKQEIRIVAFERTVDKYVAEGPVTIRTPLFESR